MSVPVPTIDLRPDHWDIIRSALRRHVPDRKVLAFGSRATWTAKDHSDLDLAIMGEEPLPLHAASALSEALGDSDLPFRVDIVDWARIDDGFRTIISRHAVSVQAPMRNASVPVSVRGSPLRPRTFGAASNWTSINLRRVCTKIGSGATPRGGKDIYLPSGPYALIRSQNVLNEGFRHEGLAHIGEQHAIELAGVDVRNRDVLLNITGDSVARACQVDPRILPARVNQHVAIIRPDPARLDPGFLRYFLVDPTTQAKLLSWAGSGGTRNALTKAMIEAVDVHAPEAVSEQRAIAHILGTLDDKIELNRRMNETLERMARALFKSWFVNFDPVRAKLEGRDTGLPKHIADLFPDRMVDSELGEIPKGWEVKALGDVVITIKGRSYRSKELTDSDTALVTLKSFARGGGYRSDGLKSFVGPCKSEQIVRPGEVVIACTDVTQAAEVIGRPAIVRAASSFRTLVASLDTMIVRPMNDIPGRAFIYCLACTDDFVAHTYAHTTGTTVLHLAKDAVPSFQFACPPRLLGERFDQFAGPLLERIQSSELAEDPLAALRDILLPKLISGETRVGDAERVVESVT